LKPLAYGVLAGAMLVCAPSAYAQGANAARSFNPRDLSGYWLRNTVRPKEHPPLTPAGEEAIKGRIPDYKTRVPSESNDPMYKCNPQGFPRLVWEENVEGELTIYDPKNFTAPWTHPKSTFRRMPVKDVTFFGWKGL
jgi:hypothetical protein